MNFYNYSKQNSPSKQVPTSSRSSVYISPQISVRKRSNPRIQPINDDILKIGLEEDLKRIQGFKPFKAEDISFKLPPLPFRFSKGGGSILQNMLTESSKKNSRLSTELDSESHLIKRRSSIYKIQTKRDMLLPDIKNEDSNVTSYHIEKNQSEYIPYHNFHPYGCYEEEDEERIMEGHYFKFIGPENPLVRTILHTNGYRETGINGSSTILWSTRPFKDEVYKELGYYQKINHFPKSQEIYKRDFLVRKISRMQITHGFRQFDFIPKTFILPNEFELLEKDYGQNSGIRYIIKHQDASKGKDAIITRNIEKIKLRKAMPLVVSHYIEDPFLINGSKFTMKAYVIVASIHPLRIYMHKEGLLKYPTKRPQNTKPEKIAKSHMRNRSLQPPTNSSINMDFLDTKPTEQSILFTDEDIFSYVSSFSGLKTYLEARDKNSSKLFEQIEDIVIKTIISVESDLFRACSFLLPHSKNCFEFLTFEILVDNKLKPWIIDVKTAPCIEHMSPYHQKMEREILTDLLNIINIVPNQYRKLQLSSHPTGLHSYPFVIQESSEQKITLTPNLKPVELLSKDEKLIVEETNIEWERKGNFKRIFPSESVHTYANYFETERPYNNLLRRIAWMNAKNNTVKKKKIRAKNAGSLSDRKYSVSPSPVYRKANIL